MRTNNLSFQDSAPFNDGGTGGGNVKPKKLQQQIVQQ
jgi:hypothetical protein